MWKSSQRKKLKQKLELPEESSTEDIQVKEQKITPLLDDILSLFKNIYNVPDNKDVQIRELTINKLERRAAAIFINTIADAKEVEDRIIQPLLTNKDEGKTISDIITSQTVRTAEIVKDALNEINNGNTVLLVDGSMKALVLNTSNFQSRALSTAEDEVILKGPKEAFNEKAVTNISLVRKKIRNENLMVESIVVTKRSRNEVFILYEKDLVNDELLENIKKRLHSLDADAIQNLSLLEQYIEERKLSLFPSLLYTERPDRAASFLEDGHIVLLMDNSPSSLVLPATFWSFFHTPEEHYLRFPFGNITRALRMAALFIAVFTSAIYISITNYHSEMIPPDLLLAIASTREKVPFPAVFEIYMMEIAFELIREAGLRVPNPIGPTIGIVGALILGEAAVTANIISPIVIIVVALGGLCSFSVSDINLNYAVRIIKFIMILAAGLFGIYGMTAFFMIGIFYLVSIKSFGVPYLAPLSPHYKSSGDTLFRSLLENETFRPGYLKPKDIQKKGGD